MYLVGAPTAEINMLLEYLKTKHKDVPILSTYNWEEMSIKEKEQYFVILRMALEHCKQSMDISEEALTYLFSLYTDAFEFLANTDSLLRTALNRGTHAFFMADNPEVVASFKKLIRQPTEAK